MIEENKPTKTLFKEAIRKRLVETYEWAKDESKLERFMETVNSSIDTDKANWLPSGPAYQAALRDIGLPAKTGMKELRKLPA